MINANQNAGSAGKRRTPEFYTIPLYAERLNVSQKTIRRLIGKGTLVGHKIGAVWRISQADATVFERINRICGLDGQLVQGWPALSN